MRISHVIITDLWHATLQIHPIRNVVPHNIQLSDNDKSELGAES